MTNKGTFGGWEKSIAAEYVLKEQFVSDGSGGTITFDNIPQRFQDIRFTFALRSNNAAVSDTVSCRINDDTAAVYSTQDLNAQATTVTAAENIGTATPIMLVIAGDTAPAGSFAIGEIKSPFYSSTMGNKQLIGSWLTRNDTASGECELYYRGLFWFPTVAGGIPREGIKKIQLSLVSGTGFVAGSVITMYGAGQLSPSRTAS
jgi:hypothetical protein